MSTFPTSRPSYTGFTPGHTLLVDIHASQHNLEQADISALSDKIGLGASTPTANQVLTGNGTGTSSWSQVNLTTMVSGVLPVANGGTAASTAAAARTSLGAASLSDVYPVGCVYTETTGVNPATTFGMGTWISFGAGRVLVGNGTSDQAFTAGASGGESNHTLITAEIPSHTHVAGYTDANWKLTSSGSQNALINFNPADVNNQALASTSTGGGASHNNLQPYLVVYFWKRTA